MSSIPAHLGPQRHTGTGRIRSEAADQRAIPQGASTIETGQLIAGHYRLVEFIGSGAMGVVWRAVDVRLERSVAVKKVIGQQGMSEADRADLRKRAMREAKIAARLQHPNAIVVYDIAEHEGDTCLVMEYLPSRSLADLIAKRGTLPVPEVARIGEQVASALLAAHEAGIVHRDVKPANILIDPSGVTKLTDFGISRAQGDVTLTATGLVGGTPAYIAPELARGADPAPPSDVFALGATLYYAIEGSSPYGANQNQLALLHTAASGKIVPPTRAGAATSLLNSLLRVDPDERPSMKQAGERLAAIASGGGVPAPPTPLLPAQPPKAGTRMLAPWQRTKTAEQPAPAATTRATQPHATAMYSAVDYPGPDAPRPPKKTPAAAPPRTAKRSGNRGLMAGLAGFVALLATAVFLLVNSADGPKPAAEQDGAPSSSAPQDPTSSTSAGNGGGRIQFGPAGQLVVDYYSFPQGMDASWNMLTPGAQQVFGDKAKFAKHWTKSDAVWANTARGSYNDDGSVTITATMVIQKDGKERAKPVSLRVVRANGELRIDSDTR